MWFIRNLSHPCVYQLINLKWNLVVIKNSHLYQQVWIFVTDSAYLITYF